MAQISPSSAAGKVGRHAQPATVPPLPDVGIPAPAVAAVGPSVLEARMDQRHVAQVLDLYLGRTKIREGMRASDAGQEAGLVREGAVGVGGAIVVGEMLVVPGYVGFLCREKIAPVESLEGSKILRLGRHALSSSQRLRALIISQVPSGKKSPCANPHLGIHSGSCPITRRGIPQFLRASLRSRATTRHTWKGTPARPGFPCRGVAHSLATSSTIPMNVR